ncbi:MAG: hypothetical protein M0Z70_05190 [Nitrospiraceae bacterium]|nr:hypothetical protein [Nitrospiraceae bacterium]
MSKEFDDILNPPKTAQGQGDDIISADNITATLTISRAELTRAMQKLHQLTGQDRLHNAFNLIWYKKMDIATAETMGMITTLYRCAKDGTVKPPVDLDEFYRETNGLNTAPPSGIKPSM